MMQLMVFFFASYALAQPGTWVETVSQVFPVSSPFAMLAHAAQSPEIWPHVIALGWQALWVGVIVRVGAQLVPPHGDEVRPCAGARAVVRTG